MIFHRTDGLTKPGIPVGTLISGLTASDDDINLIIGPPGGKKFAINMKRKHLCSIEYFATALSDSKLEETKSGKILLPNEDPELFVGFFIPWMYRGLNVSEYTSKPVLWVKLFLMVDKFRLKQLSIDLLKHASNMLNENMHAWSKEDDSAAIECYKLLQHLPARFMVVHAAYMAQAHGGINISSMHIELADTNWGNEFARWSSILPSPAADLGRPHAFEYFWYNAKEDGARGTPNADEVLMPLLFEEVAWPDWLSPQIGGAALPAGEKDERKAIRNYLGMDA